MTKQEAIDKSLSYFDEGYACSQSVLLTFSSQFNLDDSTAKLISSTFGGGMGRLRQKCGALTGSFMVLGLQFGNTDPKDMDSKLSSYQKVRDLNRLFEDIHGTSNCSELLAKHVTQTGIDERQHHKIICRKVIEDTVGLLYEMMPVIKVTP